MSKHTLIWTLQAKFPLKWKQYLDSKKFSLKHIPLINLCQTKDFDDINHELVHKNIIITSPYASSKIVNNLSRHFNFYTVGKKTASILIENGYIVKKTYNSSKDLFEWISSNSNEKFIHLCSKLSNEKISPENVIMIPFYEPIKNKNFNSDDYLSLSKCTIVFGSPSGVDVWFENLSHKEDFNYACMGQTTANKIHDYTDEKVIFPKDSTIETLINLVEKRLNEKQ